MQSTHFFEFFGLLLCLNICDGRTYNQYRLYRAVPVNDDHLNFYKNMSDIYEVNFWRSPGQLYMPIEFTIHPNHVNDLEKEAFRRRLYVTTILKDVQEAFDNQTIRSYTRRKMKSFDFRSYFRLQDIYDWLYDLANGFPEEVSVFSIGTTSQNKLILAVKLVHKGSRRRSSVIVEGGIHAREWISIAFVAYLINELVHARTSDNARLKKIAFTYEWYFIPVANPDGYEYTHTKDRLWRKSRGRGYGVDLNRNFASAFGSVGVSWRTLSEIYCGHTAFSEPESRAMRKFIERNSQNLEYYISFHAYGQVLIFPYAYSEKHLDNFDEMRSLGKVVTDKIARRYGTRYAMGTAYDTLGYRAAGASGCWVKEQFRVPYVATFELRDLGEFGFALPAERILPTCRETMDGVIEMFQPRSQTFSKLPYEFKNQSKLPFQHKKQSNSSSIQCGLSGVLLIVLVIVIQ